MPIFKIENIEINAISACVPIQNEWVSDYTHVSEQERKMFTFGTGVKQRRIAPEHICTSDMCFESAQKIFKDTNTPAEDIDVVIFVSQSPDYFLPATSILLQDRLGCSKNVMAFDINLGCSGYVYGLSIIANLMSLPGINKGLLLCGDKSSFALSYTDKSTYPLFGDAGTATLISKKANASPMYFNLQSDGSGWESIIIRGGGTRQRYSDETCKKVVIEPGIERGPCNLELDGMEVFNFSLREVKPNVLTLLEYAQCSMEEIDYLVMHQANKLMNESVRKKLKYPKEKTPYSIQDFGNTSSASIPLTIVTELGEKLKNNKSKLLLSGFGVGYSWGSVLVDVENLVITDLVEIE